jgi:hypothetical protein
MKKIVMPAALACALALVAPAQKADKPWMEWTKKDAEKVLNDSPWGQTQTVTDTSEMFFSPTATPDPRTGASRAGASRDSQGSTNQATNVSYRVRFFSARPIRQALVRILMLNSPGSEKDAAFVERVRNFAELQSNEKIIVTVTFESKDARFGNVAMQAFNSAVTATLKNDTYLQRRDGRKLFLEEYVPPGRDGFGARFIFPRAAGEVPFISQDAGQVRFYSKLAGNIEISMRFDTAKMLYNGALEY